MNKPAESISNSGIYISVPYCRQKCTYCNFASAARPMAELPHYLSSLEFEIAQRHELWQQTNIPVLHDNKADSIYMGGGTPSLLTAAQMNSLLRTVRTSFTVDPNAEITIEASPENVTPSAIAGWIGCGINRVSLGVQSMVAQELRAVGRMHDAATVSGAVAALRFAGIDNISIDLIAGLPHQTSDSWERTLNAVLDLAPPQVSVYMLEVDEDSRLGGELLQGGARYGAAAVPAEEHIVEFYSRAVERLAEAGLPRYEISNFALRGAESRHNEKYWTSVPYYGFGVDAHSFDGARRWANVDGLTEYFERMNQRRSPVRECRTLEATEKLEERFFLGLRRREGISLALIQSQFGNQVDGKIEERIREYCEVGWLDARGDQLRLTDQGVLFSNEVFAGLLA